MTTSKLKPALDKLSSGAIEEGVGLLRELSQGGEHRAEALGHLAWALHHNGQFEEALRVYAKLIELTPENDEVCALRAQVLVRSGKVEEGIQEAGRVLARSPRSRIAMDVMRETQEALYPIPHDQFKNRTSSRTINPVVTKLEEDVKSFPTSADPRIGAFLYTIVRMLQPTLVVETGTYIGYSAICISQALEDNGGGHLHSFDLFLDHEKYQSPFIDTRDALQIVRKHLQEAELAHRATLYKGPSDEMMVEFFADRETDEPVDFVFIDGDHSAEGCLKDMEMVARRMNPGGVMVLHDTDPEKCNFVGPRFALEEGVGDYFRWTNLNTPDGFGLAIVQKHDQRNWRAPLPSLVTLAWDRLFVSTRWKG